MKAFALAALVVLAGCKARFGDPLGPDREEDKPVPEQAVVLPQYPNPNDLIEFGAGPSGAHRFFIDGRTLDVGADGVVRYTLVVRSSGGATSTSFEGIRCRPREKRVYALGHPPGKWVEARRSVWEPIPAAASSEHHLALHADYFCPGRAIVPNREAALRALRSGLYGSGSGGIPR